MALNPMKKTQPGPVCESSWKSALGVTAASLAFLLARTSALADTQDWTPAGSPNGVGVWDTATANWDAGSLWTGGNVAAFSGVPGVVTITPGGVTASGILANTGVYVIAGGLLTLTGEASIVTASDLVIESVIAGTGLNKSGAAALLLNAAATYTGPTNVTAGALRIGVDAALPASTSLTVTGPATVFDLNGHAQTAAAVSLQDGGTLDDRAGGGSLTSTSAYDLRDGRVFVSLGGSVGLNKTGAGLVSLVAANTYTGPTNVTGGTLREAAANALPSTTLLTVDGAGAVNDLDGYSQTVAGLSLRHGGTVADSFGGASLTSLSDFDVQDGTVSAALAGSVGLTKTTTGTVLLSGHNTYSGLTRIDAGTLIVDGSIAGDARVAGGTLGGSGSIGGNVLNQAAVAPGNGTGPLTIRGNYTQASTGSLNILLTSPTAYGRLVVGGRATLAGSLVVSSANGFAPGAGDRFTILTAGRGVTGAFTSLHTGTVLNLSVTMQPNAVVLAFTQGAFDRPAWDGFPNLTHNQRSVARALDRIAGDPRAAALVGVLDRQSLASLPHSLDAIAPDELASVFDLGIGAADAQTANLERRFEEIRAGFAAPGTFALKETGGGKETAPPSPAANAERWGWFATGNSSFLQIGNGANGVPGYDITTAGSTVGVDYRVTENLTLGLVASYVHAWTDLANNGRIGVDGGQGGIYGVWTHGGFHLNGAVTGGENSYAIRRAGLGGIASGDTSGSQFDSFLETGYDFHAGNWTFGPTASLEYTWVGLNAFDERGSLAALRIHDSEADSLRSRLGLRVAYDAKVCGLRVVPDLRLTWRHEYLNSARTITASFPGMPGAFAVNGPSVGSDSLLVTAGVTVELTPLVSVFADYNGEAGRTASTAHSVVGGVRVKF